MLIEAGFDIAFECPAPTPMNPQLSIHPSRDADLLTPDRIASDPPLPMRSYLDLFGNRVTRVEIPAELVTFSDRFDIQDSGEPDETPPDVRTTPIADLPDENAAVPAREPVLRQRQARRFSKDARHNHPRIGRIVMGRGRDAADLAMSTAFGVANLTRFTVVTNEKVQGA
jgi:hypothetical protein